MHGVPISPEQLKFKTYTLKGRKTAHQDNIMLYCASVIIMESQQIRNYYQFVLKELNSFEVKIEPLLQFARDYNENITSMLQSFLGAAKIFRDGTDTHYVTSNPSILNDFTNLIKNFKSSFLVFPAFLEYGSMKSRISDYKKENGFADTEIESFYAVLDETFVTYQEYLQTSDDRKKAVIFGQSVIKLEEYFKSLKVSYENTINLLSAVSTNKVSRPQPLSVPAPAVRIIAESTVKSERPAPQPQPPVQVKKPEDIRKAPAAPSPAMPLPAASVPAAEQHNKPIERKPQP